MAIDMSQFYQVFFEEAGEHLASMESLLVSMDVAAPDPEQLNALFRAAHSIKGSSGTFGFNDMAAVTHVMETLLDKVRKSELALSSAIVDACLDAGDVLRAQLAAHMEGELENAVDGAEVCSRLEALCSGVAPAPPEPDEEMHRYLLRFVPDRACRERPELIDNLVEELVRLGRVTGVQRPHHGTEGECSMVVESGQPADALRGMVEFLAEAGTEVVVASVDGQGPEPLASQDEAAYGFFDVPPAPEGGDDEAFGLFDGAPGCPGDAFPATEDAYGLFEPQSSPGASEEAEVAPDGSYGLFVPAPAMKPPESPATDEGYGFFGSPPPEASGGPGLNAVAEIHPRAESDGMRAGDVGQRRAPGARTSGDSSIRVSVEKVDQMINLVGELVITQAMLNQAADGLDPVLYERLMNGLTQLERNTRDLQESVMSIRMLPISVVFSRFPRVVRDVSKKLGKRVELRTIGEGTELDKGLVERISDPLTHLVRNSLDHGIEAPERRRAAGKPETGIITLKAYHHSGNVVIEVGDDGAGLNRQKILEKARERGLEHSESMSDADVWQLIFEPGFSTADQVTDVSGRGVGMDVVKRNIAAMGGRVEIESMAGIGTRMTVRLPLTLAILDGMSVGVGSDTYIIPLNYVVESLQPKADMMRSISGVERLIQVRGEYLPVVGLGEYFCNDEACTQWSNGIMVILEADGAKAALFVDQLIGQHQVVIKSLEANYRRVPGVSGATIMGDGRVALILDAAALVSQTRKVMPAAA